MNLSSSSPKNNDLPNQTFLSWLKSQIDLLIGNILGLVSTGYLIFALIYYADGKNLHGIGKYLTPNNIQIIIYWLHLIFITYCITKLVSILDDNKVGFYRTKITYRRLFKDDPTGEMFGECKKIIKFFKKIFICFWVSMFLLYISFIFTSKWESEPKEVKEVYSTVSETDNPITWEKVKLKEPEQPSKVVLESISLITVKTDQEKKSAEKKLSEFNTDDYRKAFIHKINQFFVYTMNTVSLMFVFWCFIILYRPPIDEKKTPPINEKRIHNQNKLFHYSLIATVILIAAFPLFFKMAADEGIYTETTLNEYVALFDAISGVLNAVALALLIARFDSKLVGLPSWLVGILYFYAAVQPLFVVFELSGDVSATIKTFVLISVFTLKIYFFFIILYTFQTGRLLNYILCFPTLNTKVDSIFQNQFDIYIKEEHHSHYNFIIKRKNSIIYTTDSTFESREECEKEISLLLEIAKNKNSYTSAQKVNGSYIVILSWISDRTSTSLFCISIDMKSKEEADELIEESIEKLPYCKFDYNKPSH